MKREFKETYQNLVPEMPAVRIKELLQGRAAAQRQRPDLPRSRSCPSFYSNSPTEAIPCEYIPRSKSAIFNYDQPPHRNNRDIYQNHKNSLPYFICPHNPTNSPAKYNPNYASQIPEMTNCQQRDNCLGLRGIAATGFCPCPCGPGGGLCSPCGCGPCACGPCGRCLPPPCNTPPRCMQYMTGYYYYPYGSWFCGPYHVSGTCVPGGPVRCGPCGPCGPAAPCPGGPCGPCCIGPCGCGPCCCVFGPEGMGAGSTSLKSALKDSTTFDLASCLPPLTSGSPLPPGVMSCLATVIPPNASSDMAKQIADISSNLACCSPKCCGGPCRRCCFPCGRCCGPCCYGPCRCGCGCGPCGCSCGPCGCGCGPCGSGCFSCGCGCGPYGRGCGPCGCGSGPCGCGPCGCCGCSPWPGGCAPGWYGCGCGCGPCGCGPCGCRGCGCCCCCAPITGPGCNSCLPGLAAGGLASAGPLEKCIYGDCKSSECERARDPDAVCYCPECRAKRAPLVEPQPICPCPTNLTPRQNPCNPPGRIVINPNLAKNYPFNKNKYFERAPPPVNTAFTRFYTTSIQQKTTIRKCEFGRKESYHLRLKNGLLGKSCSEMDERRKDFLPGKSCSDLPLAYDLNTSSRKERDHQRK